MNKKKIYLILLVLAIIAGLSLIEVTQGSVGQFVFDQMSYSYTSKVVIPSIVGNGTLGGYYTVDGKGRDFNFLIKLPGAERSESPLDYTADGVRGTGKIDKIQFTFGTLKSLLYGDLKGAVFGTKLSGTYDMSCAAWTGEGTFSNNDEGFTGTFKIDAALTYWEGNYTILQQNKSILIVSDYSYIFGNDPTGTSYHNTFYL